MKKISLITNLTLDKANNLRIGLDGFWIFEIFIKEENLLNVPKFAIDIYYTINSTQYNAIDIFYMDNLKLSCITELKSYELINIKLNKTSNSLSTATWKNKEEFNGDNIPMINST